jgi:hypothetical protein
MNPLNIKIENGELVIRIGVPTLAWAADHMDEATVYDQDLRDFKQAWTVTDPAKFAKGVLNELIREEEDGSNPVTRMFDAAFLAAVDNGAEGVELADE